MQPDQTATRPEIVTVRVAAVNALARNGSSTTIRELAAADDLAEVRRAAYEWLARLDDAEGLAERGLGDAVPALRAAAACLLADVLLRRAANDAPTWQWRADAFPRPPPPAFEHAPRRLDAAAAEGFENAASALIQAAQRDAAIKRQQTAAGILQDLGLKEYIKNFRAQDIFSKETLLRLEQSQLGGVLGMTVGNADNLWQYISARRKVLLMRARADSPTHHSEKASKRGKLPVEMFFFVRSAGHLQEVFQFRRRGRRFGPLRTARANQSKRAC